MRSVPSIPALLGDTLPWRKSRRSLAGNDCVESCRPVGGLIAFRDSKAPDGDVLVITAGAGRALLDRIKEGGFDTPAR